ncbi:hypothetical protein RO3G_11142 [Rhizopus delemar RA 99-880]|uniref:Synaptobrevin homolog YKT6 n=1 Tax=Rhizopus delemar (strain RA 99-880 / ATCC MYA-4621 / FGSC 9543 / NRRL 43880) TaxID=246409 RepID=I1CDA1_RHIO9|nr:hypothetical protein RO3G_11142 [Rhizopus delemar RA 99-880]|eukprot:EIE86431.1 hypothetical protein RO3G_11142 [Rhizopus delemar RA 99-880]
MNFSAITVTERTELGQRQSIEVENNVIHVYMNPQGLSGIIISDKDYPSELRFPYSHWNTADTIEYPELTQYIQKYQDPQQADNIMKVQKELDETTTIMYKTIESLLQRGEKIESLVDKSEALSAQTKIFYKTTKKMNSCCVVISAP